MKPKQLATLMCLLASTTPGFSQGTVAFANTLTTFISTNATGVGGTTGPTATDANGFYYGLFVAPSTVSTANVQQLLDGPWIFSGVYATNVQLASGGRLNGGAIVNVPSWDPLVTNSFVVAGWSAGLGNLWPTVAAKLAGATFADGAWSGPNLPQGEFFGFSDTGFGEAGGGWPPVPPFVLFGASPTQMGTPVLNGFDLYATVAEGSFVPEPSGLILSPFFLLALRRARSQRSFQRS